MKNDQKKKSIFEKSTIKEESSMDYKNTDINLKVKKINSKKRDDTLDNKEINLNKNNKVSKKQKRNFEIKTGVKRVKKDNESVVKDNKNIIKDNKDTVKKSKDNKNIIKVNKDNKYVVKNNKDTAKKSKEKDQIGVKLSKLEKEILHKGTIKDKINLLTLIVEKNPTEQNYKNLLFYTENQRNDVIYIVLKNLKDLLISKGVPKNYYIKQKITKCFEINVRNTFIKTKVLRLVYELLKNNILFMDLIYTFINKIGDKKEIETYIRENLTSLYEINEEAILLNIEDFYFKNMNFKCTNSVLKFLGSVVPSDNKKMIGIYRLILDNINEYKDEHRNIVLENCLNHLSTLLEGLDNPKSFLEEDEDTKKLENILISSYSTDKIAFASIKILFMCQNPKIKIFITNIIKNNILVRYNNLKEVVEYIKKIYLIDKDETFIKNILNSSVCYKKEFLISILSIILQNKIDFLNIMEILKNHYSNVVRKMVNSIINKEYEMTEIDPFDKIQLEAYENIFN